MDPFDPDNERFWPDENGVNILGTPLGTTAFVSAYLMGKASSTCSSSDSSEM